jgi:predicted ATPase
MPLRYGFTGDPVPSAEAMKQAARASFHGRTEELAELARRLAEPGALVSVTGPPGSGKSRLARAYASTNAAAHPGGVHWIDLADARTAVDMCAALASALGEQLAPEARADELARRLSHAIAARGEALFVLDDLEHVADAAPAIIQAWRAEAEAATFLITSRERPRIADEWRLEVGPLPLPEEGQEDPEQIARLDSVRLFLDRARAVRSGYSPSREELRDVAALVRALDGIPLAIELCAARAALLGTRQILERLPALDLLAHGARGGPARHATVRGAIDASWDLLTPEERSAFAACGIFRGGFTMDAAERVLEGGAIDRLQALVDKSLVHVYDAPGVRGELRYRMYEPLARYAQEQLDRSGERPAVSARHAAHFAEAGARWAAAVDERDGAAAFQRLLSEQANLVAALETTRNDDADAAQATRALELALALALVLQSRGPLSELTRMLDEVLERGRAEAASPRLVARAAIARGLAKYVLGDVTASAADFEAAATSAPGSEVEALARVHLAVTRAWADDLPAAAGELALATDLARRAAAPRVEALARTLRARWVLAREGRLDEARRELEVALILLHRSGAPRDESRVHAYLGHLSFDRGAADDALSHYQRATTLLHDLGDRRLEAELLIGMAVVEQELGRRSDAHAHLAAARTILEVMGVDDYLGVIELHLGALALDEDRPEEAAQHYADAAALLVAPRSAGLVAVAIAGRAVGEARGGRPSDAPSRMAQATALAQAAGAGIDLTVELLACALDLLMRQEGAAARGEELQRAAAKRPAFAEPLQEVVRVYRHARRLLAATLGVSAASTDASTQGSATRGVWLIRDDGRAFRAPHGAPVSLDRRGALSRLLRALAERHQGAPGEALGVYALAEAGWPGERIAAVPVANRVRVALTALRKLGLRDLLVSRDDGYLLDPRAQVAIVTDMSPTGT